MVRRREARPPPIHTNPHEQSALPEKKISTLFFSEAGHKAAGWRNNAAVFYDVDYPSIIARP